MAIKYQIERVAKQIKIATKIKKFLIQISEHESSCIGILIDYHFGGEYLRMEVKQFSHVHTARIMLREALGSWQDKMSNQFISQGIFYTTWRSKDNELPIEIWYGCPQDNIDKELQKPNCKVVEQTIKEYDYVCEI